MEMRQVGNSGLKVSRLGLGTMTWGRDTDADEAAGQLEAFVEAGGTLIETANIYGDGDAESILGTLIPDVVAREKVLLTTTTVGTGGGRGALISALDVSLKRLDTDHVDLWQVHGWDAVVPYQETCAALAWAVTSGRTRYIGVSGYRGWQLATMATELTHLGVPVTSIETEYSLVERDCETSIGPAAATHGVGLLAWAPLGRGVLTGKYRHGTPADSRGASPNFARYVGRHRNDAAGRVVEAVVTAADGLGTSPLAVACAWVRDRPGVAAAIIGARDAAQLLGGLAAEQVTLPPEITSALADVSDPASSLE